MDPRRLLEELLAIARKIGVEVKTQHLRVPIRSAGGLCRVNGRQVILLDGRAESFERAAALAEALGELTFDMTDIQMPSEVRALIEKRGSSLAPNVRSALAPKPGLAKSGAVRRGQRRSFKS